MPFLRPSLTELRRQGVQDVTSGLGGGDALLRTSVLLQLTWAQAGLAHGHYGYLDWIARQAVPWTAQGEYLEGWGALIGVLRKPAAPASGTAIFAAVAGAVVPVGTAVIRDDGARYATVAEARADESGLVEAEVVAEATGAAGNAAGEGGIALTLGSSVAGVQAKGAAMRAIAGGADAEADADFRTRVLGAYADPPQGGSRTDYRRWALEVPGVTRAWVDGGAAGPGTVVVYVMLDDANAAGQGLPIGRDGVASGDMRAQDALGDQARVAEHLWDKQPVTALVYAVSPVPYYVAVRVTDLVADTATIRAGIETALKAMLRAQAAPGGVVDVASFYSAIDGVAGVTGFNLAAPAGAVEAPPGHIALLGGVLYG